MLQPKWHDELPQSMREVLRVDRETLGDFSEPVERLEILARFATQRAIEGMAQERYSKGEIVEMGNTIEPPEKEAVGIEEKEISLRFDVAIRANKEVVKARQMRLDMQKKHKDKASDVPVRANVTFDVRHTAPERKIAALKKLRRFDEAKKLAEQHNIEYSEEVVE